MIYFTSDLHLGHNKDFVYAARGFDNIEDHDAAIIERWNSVVKNEDTVYILGDLMLNDNEHGIKCLEQLNGIKFFIRGNHDTDTRLNLYMDEQGANIAYLGDASILKYKGYRFYLSHYPTLTGNPGEDTLKHLFGHTHQKTNFYENNNCMYHVGVDSHNCYPVSIDEIITELKEKIKE